MGLINPRAHRSRAGFSLIKKNLGPAASLVRTGSHILLNDTCATSVREFGQCWSNGQLGSLRSLRGRLWLQTSNKQSTLSIAQRLWVFTHPHSRARLSLSNSGLAIARSKTLSSATLGFVSGQARTTLCSKPPFVDLYLFSIQIASWYFLLRTSWPSQQQICKQSKRNTQAGQPSGYFLSLFLGFDLFLSCARSWILAMESVLPTPCVHCIAPPSSRALGSQVVWWV